jgi:hypothetical protein
MSWPNVIIELDSPVVIEMFQSNKEYNAFSLIVDECMCIFRRFQLSIT